MLDKVHILNINFASPTEVDGHTWSVGTNGAALLPPQAPGAMLTKVMGCGSYQVLNDACSDG